MQIYGLKLFLQNFPTSCGVHFTVACQVIGINTCIYTNGFPFTVRSNLSELFKVNQCLSIKFADRLTQVS